MPRFDHYSTEFFWGAVFVTGLVVVIGSLIVLFVIAP